MNSSFVQNRVVVRGAGDVASGVIHRLRTADFEVIALEKPNPDCVRRMVCFAEAFYEKKAAVEGITSVLVNSAGDAIASGGPSNVPLLIDPTAESLPELSPIAVIDARMLKQNIDTTLDMAPIVIGLGPGFVVGKNCHAAVETIRGDALGRIIYSGSPQADTGVPAPVNGVSVGRVLRSPADGTFSSRCNIGDRVKSGQITGAVDGISIIAEIDGIVRGLIRDGLTVSKEQKIGDIDPRGIPELCYQISDKARAIGVGSLEALQTLASKIASG